MTKQLEKMNYPWDKVEKKLDEAYELFETCLFEEALELLEQIEKEYPGLPDTMFQKALILERDPKSAKVAQDLFQEASKLDPENFPLPLKISIPEIETIVKRLISDLPEDIQDELEGLSVVVEEIPSDEDLLKGETPFEPTIWGLFRGQTLADQKVGEGSENFPPEVVLYRKNLARDLDNREDLIEEIKITVLHEIGHYLGMDEDWVEKAGF